jgi:hypothetical protein
VASIAAAKAAAAATTLAAEGPAPHQASTVPRSAAWSHANQTAKIAEQWAKILAHAAYFADFTHCYPGRHELLAAAEARLRGIMVDQPQASPTPGLPDGEGRRGTPCCLPVPAPPPFPLLPCLCCAALCTMRCMQGPPDASDCTHVTPGHTPCCRFFHAPQLDSTSPVTWWRLFSWSRRQDLHADFQTANGRPHGSQVCQSAVAGALVGVLSRRRLCSRTALL